MDNRTVQRALQGDQEAARRVEAHLRVAARQLLAHPSLGVGDPVTQRVLANAAVAEALERELRVMDTLLAAAVMAAARRGVEHMRRLDGAERGAGHLPPGILVSVALVPQILASTSREAAERHLASCAECTDQARSVRDAAASTSVEDDLDDPEEVTAQHHISAALDGARQVAAIGVPVELGGEQDAAGAAEAMLQRLLETADAVEASREGGEAGAESRRRRRRQGERGDPPLRALPLLLLAGVLGLALSRMDLRCRPVQQPLRIVPELALLADTTLPSSPPASEWASGLDPAFHELQLSDCTMAANRFRLARMRDPSVSQAWHWEGLSAVCAGRGDQAVKAFEHARGLDPELPDVGWGLAQGALLAGRIDLAELELRALCGGTTARVGQACAQLARISDQ